MTQPDANGSDGRYLSESKQRILEEMEAGVPYTATELAEGDILDIGRRTISHHLQGLAERGILRRKENSPRTVTFWQPVSEADCESADEPTDEPADEATA